MESWILILVVLSIVLVFIEIFVVPGFGVVGVLGFAALVAGTFLAAQTYGFVPALAIFGGSLALMIGAFVLFFRSPASQWLVHSGKLASGDSTGNHLPIGSVGKTLTALRPGGKAVFSLDGTEHYLDVVTGGEFVEQNQSIRIEQVEGSRILVSKLKG